MNANAQRAVWQTATILVLDDDDQLRAGTTRALSRCGHRVLAAGSAVEAMHLAAAWPSSIDLLVCDLVLPGLGGREAANALVAHRPSMKVLFTSGYSSQGSFRRQLAESGSSFLGKPFDLTALMEAVQALLDGGRWPRSEAGGDAGEER